MAKTNPTSHNISGNSSYCSASISGDARFRIRADAGNVALANTSAGSFEDERAVNGQCENSDARLSAAPLYIDPPTDLGTDLAQSDSNDLPVTEGPDMVSRSQTVRGTQDGGSEAAVIGSVDSERVSAHFRRFKIVRSENEQGCSFRSILLEGGGVASAVVVALCIKRSTRCEKDTAGRRALHERERFH